MVVEKVDAPGNFWIEGASENQIFIGDGELGYEIMFFNLEGNLVRKIRKNYAPVEITDEYKRNFFERRKRALFLINMNLNEFLIWYFLKKNSSIDNFYK